jgi:hypothetical protein
MMALKALGLGGVAALIAIAMVSATGLAQCTVTSAPASDVNTVPGVVTGAIYIEERQNCVNNPAGNRGTGCGYDEAPPVSPPPVMWGFIFGGGSWFYEEQNGLPGMQAGGFGIIPETPGCGTIPCIIFDDPVNDETCGSGPDRLIL